MCCWWEMQTTRKKKLRCLCAVAGRWEQLEKRCYVFCVLLVGDGSNVSLVYQWWGFVNCLWSKQSANTVEMIGMDIMININKSMSIQDVLSSNCVQNCVTHWIFNCCDNIPRPQINLHLVWPGRGIRIRKKERDKHWACTKSRTRPRVVARILRQEQDRVVARILSQEQSKGWCQGTANSSGITCFH